MSKELHDQIMNLPCRRANHSFPNTESRLLYKEGHRDARHAAAELAIGYVPEASSANGAVGEVERFSIYEDHGRANMMGDDDGDYVRFDQHTEAIRAAVLAEREQIAMMVGPAFDMTDEELTEYGRDMRKMAQMIRARK